MKQVLCKLKDFLNKPIKETCANCLFVSILKVSFALVVVVHVMNMMVVMANDGKMPVFKTEVSITSKRHREGNDNTKLKFLADYIRIRSEYFKTKNKPMRLFYKSINFPYHRDSIASPGDILMWLSMSMMFFSIIGLFVWLIIQKFIYTNKRE